MAGDELDALHGREGWRLVPPPLLPALGAKLKKHFRLKLGGHVFNPSIAMHEGRQLFAWRKLRWRTLPWRRSTIWIGELGDSWNVSGGKEVRLNEFFSMEKNVSFEDPRLITDGGRVWVAFSVVHNHFPKMGMVELDEAWDPVDGWIFESPNHRIEKNWQFFSHEGRLHAVYSQSPHSVGVFGPNGFVVPHHHDHGGLWKLGEPRGSTPPVRVGDEYFSFFHSRSAKGEYHIGFYSFEAKPPFRVLRWPSAPCFSPFGTETSDECKGLKVLFPGGAVLTDGEWLMAYGVGDTACCLARFRHEELLSAFTSAPTESSRALPASKAVFAKL